MPLSTAKQAKARLAARRAAREEANKAASNALRMLSDCGVLDPQASDGPHATHEKAIARDAVRALINLERDYVVSVVDLGNKAERDADSYDYEADDRNFDAAREDRIFGRRR